MRPCESVDATHVRDERELGSPCMQLARSRVTVDEASKTSNLYYYADLNPSRRRIMSVCVENAVKTRNQHDVLPGQGCNLASVPSGDRRSLTLMNRAHVKGLETGPRLELVEFERTR